MMPALEPVIGLEIHVQLSTATKMFCGCELSFGEPPNTRTCPVCLGLPGALPVVNAQAIRSAVVIGLALGAEIAPRSIFHRKNYFYPDLPKGYQISQYDVPICSGGNLGAVRLHRIHLEEDAAKLVHEGSSGRIHGSDASVVDFNRGGTPLVEIVTEPDVRSAAQAREWLGLLRTTLRQLGVSDVNMEEGSLRCDANVSLRPAGSDMLGTKTELKNMNSFRFIERGIEVEIGRQAALLEAGEPVVQETLHFDPASGAISSLRSKEEAHDYRYFPEPDLVPVAVSDRMIEDVRGSLPELPAERAQRYEGQYGLTQEMAQLLAFRVELGQFFERAERSGTAPPRLVANWVTGEFVALLGDESAEDSGATPEGLATLVGMVDDKTVTAAAAKQVLARLHAEGGDPAAIVEAEGLGAMGGGDELDALVAAAIAANPDAVEKLRAGKGAAIGALVGHVMREAKGRADGGQVQRLVREQLGL